MNLTPLITPELAVIEKALAAHPRMHGYYLLMLVAIEPPLADLRDEGALDAVFERLDDSPWPSPENRPRDQTWSDHRVEASQARSAVIDALVGGPDVGHTRNTIEPHPAVAIWEAMESQFGPERDYYIGLGFGRREYVFQRGAVIVDRTRAGILFVVEND